MLTKWYKLAISTLRISIVLLLLSNLIQPVMEMSNADFILSVILALYALFFSISKPTKWKSIMELCCIVTIALVYSDSALYLLFLIPIVVFASRNNKRRYIYAFSGIFGLFWFVKTGMVMETLVITAILFMVLHAFFENFKFLEKLENDIFLQKEQSVQMEKELAKQNSEMKQISTMLAKSVELIDAKTKEDIIQMMLSASKEFFDSYFVVFYQKKKNHFVKTHELGQNDKYTVEETVLESEIEGHNLREDRMEVEIKFFNKKWGLLRLYGKRNQIGTRKNKHFISFEEFDLEIILIYANQVMVRIQDVELAKKNEFMATHDMLTEIPNRTFFLKMFDQFLYETERGSHFSLVIVDIDHFKHFNDTYGHQKGDQVLKIVAETLKNSVRSTDFVGRIGGEEFAILLKNPKENSFQIANKVRRMVSVIPTNTRQLTVSMGVAEYGKDGKGWTDLHNNADTALYRAKENGRNQVVMYDESFS